MAESANAAKTAEGPFRYLISETGPFVSLDPLNGDSTVNLPVVRMIYHTPLEVSSQNQLTSAVLDSFRYDKSAKTIHWVVKEGLRYSDGTALTPEDVAFAVARMSYARPKFPVLEEISGVADWAQKAGALKTLPSGIRVKGREISIQLERDLPHPLFRFCLELFSIIPKRCVDLQTNKISCSEIPTSGYYRIKERSGPKSVLFERSGAGPIQGEPAPEQIRFEYVNAQDLLGGKISMAGKAVAAGAEPLFVPGQMTSFEAAHSVRYLPAARFSGVLINPEAAVFQSVICRRLFAEAFRAEKAGAFGPQASAEASLFTKILPGYQSHSDLQKAALPASSSSEEAKCRKLLASKAIPWGFAENDRNGPFMDLLRKTLKKLGNQVSEPVVAKDEAHFTELFLSGKIAVSSFGSGFWAQDPAGDVKMLFTPNLHKQLQFVSRDAKLQQLIGNLDSGEKAFLELNRYIYSEALVNVHSHRRRFFAASDAKLLNALPFAITSPAPWQVFSVSGK